MDLIAAKSTDPPLCLLSAWYSCHKAGSKNIPRWLVSIWPVDSGAFYGAPHTVITLQTPQQHLSSCSQRISSQTHAILPSQEALTLSGPWDHISPGTKWSRLLQAGGGTLGGLTAICLWLECIMGCMGARDWVSQEGSLEMNLLIVNAWQCFSSDHSVVPSAWPGLLLATAEMGEVTQEHTLELSSH